jgi:hypothetical protein
MILFGFLLREIEKKSEWEADGGWKGLWKRKFFFYKDRERVFRDQKQIIIYGSYCVYFLFTKCHRSGSDDRNLGSIFSI